MDYINHSNLVELYKDYQKAFVADLDLNLKHLSDELGNKLVDLQEISKEIVSLVNKAFKLTMIQGNKGVDYIKFGSILYPVERADPNIPVTLSNASVSYGRKSDRIYLSIRRAERKKLERLTFEYYSIADRITHITENLPNLNSFKCKPIRLVNNKLIKHPEDADSRVLYDSFSFSLKDGPVVKGGRINNNLNFMDKGFKYNCTQFVSGLQKALNNAISQKSTDLNSI